MFLNLFCGDPNVKRKLRVKFWRPNIFFRRYCKHNKGTKLMTSEAGHAIDMQYFVGRKKNCVRF